MANKHGAGCTCCKEPCTPCDKTLTTVAVEVDGETISWTVNEEIATLPGCTLDLRHCTTPITYDLLDYSAATAWDGRNNDCWRNGVVNAAAFGFTDGTPYAPAVPDGGCSCDGGGGGGGPGTGGGGFGGPGDPVTPTGCTICGRWYEDEDGNWNCQANEFYIATFKVHDVTASVKVKSWTAYSLNLVFAGVGTDTTVFATFSKSKFIDVQYKISLSVTGYYNDNCPRNWICDATAPVCDDPLVGLIYGKYYCENGVEGSGGDYEFRYFNCDLDTPNWVEATTSTYCFDSLMQPNGTWQTGCTSMITQCASGTIKEIDGRLGTVTADDEWDEPRPGDPTCYLINNVDKAWEFSNGLNDWIEYTLAKRPSYNRRPGIPLAELMKAPDYIDPASYDCDIREPLIPDDSHCVNGCKEYSVGSAIYQGYLIEPSTDDDIYIPCTALCFTHPLQGGILTFDDIVFDFATCPINQCAYDSKDTTGCRPWGSACCVGDNPSTVTIPIGWTSDAAVNITLNCS